MLLFSIYCLEATGFLGAVLIAWGIAVVAALYSSPYHEPPVRSPGRARRKPRSPRG
jgi:hypothetical protein